MELNIAGALECAGSRLIQGGVCSSDRAQDLLDCLRRCASKLSFPLLHPLLSSRTPSFPLSSSDFLISAPPHTLGLTFLKSENEELDYFLRTFLSSPYFSFFFLSYSFLHASFCSSLDIPLLFSRTPSFYPHLNRVYLLRKPPSILGMIYQFQGENSSQV